ncbi:MAG: response regulator [Chloroflexi bacterium]|nr:response regulator [Chloroflexota bacterium]MCI0577788.1 response regulator [Chloroflexota bacterium]MCI0643406.1 response regulator [Chloroflexota bacterium]MCI0731048.1 response regulator [Chloroflexota bacterium]
MADKIRILIVDDLPTTRESVRKLLNFEPNVELIGEAATGREAITAVRELKPDIVLMDINMPDMDGITASQQIVGLAPSTQIIMMSVQSETDYIRRAMVAGARDFLTKPFSLDELLTAIHHAYERKLATPATPVTTTRPVDVSRGTVTAAPVVTEGGIIAVYSPKGGSGCTTIAVNLAVSLARQRYNTVLVDANLQFGDVAVMLNVKPVATIVDVLTRVDDLEPEFINSVVTVHRSGVKVLPGPPRPEMAEMVHVEHMEALLKLLRQLFDFVVVDTGRKLDDVTLALLEKADRILLVTQQDLPTIKNASRFLDLTNDLEFPRDKVILIVNRLVEKQGISPLDISKTLKRPAPLTVPADERVARQAADQGTPLVLGQSQKRPIAVALSRMAQRVVTDMDRQPGAALEEKPARRGLFGGVFGRGR